MLVFFLLQIFVKIRPLVSGVNLQFFLFPIYCLKKQLYYTPIQLIRVGI